MTAYEFLESTARSMPKAVSAYSETGGRIHQEDRYVAAEIIRDGRPISVLAVMDGHRGEQVSQLASSKLLKILEHLIVERHFELPTSLDIAVKELESMTHHMHEGSTLSVVIIDEQKGLAHVAVMGDSPVVIRDRVGNLNISPDHNAISNPKERDAAIDRGAFFDGTYLIHPESHEGLQMARALGNVSLGNILNRNAEQYSLELGGESFVIIASDGVFDPYHEDTAEEIERLASMVGDGAIARDLVNDAIRRRTQDNVTAVVWRP